MNKNHRLVFNLQRFANPNTNTTSSTGLSDEMKTFYNKDLLDYAEPNLVHDQFGDKYPIPKNGGKTIEFRAYDSLAKALTPLTEGVTPDGDSLNVTAITATVDQYGNYVTISDILELTAIDNNVVQSLKVLGSQAGRTLDSITRDALAGGTNVIYAGGVQTRKGLSVTSNYLKPVIFFQAAAQLEAMNAPMIDGSYVAIIHPYAAFDLMTSSEWIDVHKYADPEAIFQGEIGKLGNVRFVQSTEAKIWKDNTCPDFYFASTDTTVDASKTYYTESGGVYTAVASPTGNPSTSGYYEKDYAGVFGTLVLGANAYGVTELTGGGLETIIKQLGSGEDPLNQRATVGWKATKVAKRLIEQYMVRIESCGSYSKTVAAN